MCNYFRVNYARNLNHTNQHRDNFIFDDKSDGSHFIQQMILQQLDESCQSPKTSLGILAGSRVNTS